VRIGSAYLKTVEYFVLEQGRSFDGQPLRLGSIILSKYSFLSTYDPGYCQAPSRTRTRQIEEDLFAENTAGIKDTQRLMLATEEVGKF